MAKISWTRFCPEFFQQCFFSFKFPSGQKIVGTPPSMGKSREVTNTHLGWERCHRANHAAPSMTHKSQIADYALAPQMHKLWGGGTWEADPLGGEQLPHVVGEVEAPEVDLQDGVEQGIALEDRHRVARAVACGR